MATAEMPPMRLADSDLRIVLLPTLDEVPSSPVSQSGNGNARIDDTFFDDEESYDEPVENPDIPTHPIPVMQAAFTESLDEVTHGAVVPKPNLRELDARARRERLLDQGQDEEPFDSTWRYRPGQRQHEVVKLIAQISFGVYLLLNGMANDQAQVVDILQGHIDEVDQFLEVAFEDLAQAVQDLTSRIDHLQLPMQNMQAFEELLENDTFRAEILDGNAKIHHILARNDIAMKQWDNDIDAGLRCTSAFADWLNSQKGATWRKERTDMDEIYMAMKHNAEGWLNAFDEMLASTQEINELTIRLMTILAEVENKAGEFNRQSWAAPPPCAFPLPGSAAQSPKISTPDITVAPSPHLESPQVASAGVNGSRASVSRSPARSPSILALSPQLQFPFPSRNSARQSSAPMPASQMSSPVLPPSRGSMQRTASMHSRHSRKSMTRRSSSAPKIAHATQVEILDLDDFGDFPLPGAAPLLPPRSTARTQGHKTADHPKLRIDTTEKILIVQNSPLKQEPESISAGNEEPLYLLQPRTYTPKPPDTPKSPMSPKMKTAMAMATQLEAPHRSSHSGLQKRFSLRQRVSLKTTPPEAIHIPPVNPHALIQDPMTGDGTPPTSNSLVPDSAYGSDGEHHLRQPYRVGSLNELSQQRRPSLIQSAVSENHQYYHPVRASPHSPLQQRPHTAVPSEPNYRPSISYPQYNRNQPSRLGGMSMLSEVTTATHDPRAAAPSIRSQAGAKSLKKKRSTFGWLKKAFSMDEEEKAAFEARRANRFDAPQQYFDPESPKFLDGKRLR
jgi:hypothetical protein